MDETTARTVLYLITGIGVVAWAAGLRFLNGACRARRIAQDRALQDLSPARTDFLEVPSRDPAFSPPRNMIFGTTEVDGEPDELIANAVSILVKETSWPIGQVKITERTGDAVAFEGTGHHTSGSQAGQCVHRGRLAFSRTGTGRTRIDYAVTGGSGRGLLVAGAVALILGVTALVVGFILVRTYAVTSNDPDIRMQTFQMAQIVHFLWPPFLFGGLYRRQYSAVRGRFEALVHNLPFYEG